MSDEKPKAAAGTTLQIQIDEETAQGVYANMATVTHSPTEFVLDFIYAQPQQPRAKVRSRIITSPQHLKQLLLALQDNVRRYEDRFGPIRPAGAGEPELH